jgi:uncharacterized protein (DUF1330 family)
MPSSNSKYRIPDEFKKEFLPLASTVFSENDGKILARPGIANAIGGKTPNRVALIAFDSLNKALGAITPNSHYELS